ncbi:MaoC family dehydratase [Scleromatobacter humisilvae]|uniref:MaoC family dehydratase n=1 Tax=Scleromatobacter humisilvae TaxID=2897159 RepID=A0A9X1YJJ5_9BURK|nr:MaoC family dehydratase [Scleromatobacter humisilvae]MCK9687494.1 MaoC family dehydratase [Scleromatobacter humisilvae]
MNVLSLQALGAGDELPPLAMPAVDRTMLALFAGASGDHNAIHIDIDVARRAGLPDVFAQGMLGMAWLGRLLTDWAPQHQLRQFDVRFQDVVHLGDELRCSGRVVDRFVHGDESRVRVALRCENQHGQAKIVGEAIVALP